MFIFERWGAAWTLMDGVDHCVTLAAARDRFAFDSDDKLNFGIRDVL